MAPPGDGYAAQGLDAVGVHDDVAGAALARMLHGQFDVFGRTGEVRAEQRRVVHAQRLRKARARLSIYHYPAIAKETPLLGERRRQHGDCSPAARERPSHEPSDRPAQRRIDL